MKKDLKGNILIVDDTPGNLHLLSTMLTAQGYKVRSVINGEMALMGARAAPPDLILLDINMPDMDGYEVCQQLKADEQTCEIPIIFISALDRTLDKVKAFTVGGVDYISKPFQLKEVLARVKNHLELRNLQKQLQANNQQLQQEIRERDRALREREQAEAALRTSEAKYRELVETANCIILRWDTDGHIQFLNRYGQEFFGYSETEILGRHVVGSIVPETDTAGKDLQSMIGDICQHPERYRLNENENICCNGDRVWVSWANQAIRNEQSELIEILSVGTDATERKRAEQALRREQEHSERLLLNILPKAIVEQLKQFEGSLAERFDEATVLFADIVNFTPLSSRLSALELVDLLNQIFSIFDGLVEQHGLEKIKTIGDAYMVAGGLPLPKPDHAQAMADLALEMLQAITQFRTTRSDPLQMRIGINTGPVVAGVIGTKKFIYDLWGDTVNIAHRMESHGIAGSIQVSASTYQSLRDRYSFEQRGTIQVKGKGAMETYLLLGRKTPN